ncbi:MAG: TonB-dependent receptor [Cyclobacteriaceae bacterium]|nr:TonB-dependent receptor [Cyclobacteriaceae bacterium]
MKSLLLTVFTILALACYGQQQANGRITDEDGQPLPGVNILVKGTSNGTISDADGNYTISNISDNTVLVFSFIGYTTQEISVAGRSTIINVTLQADIMSLEEVVVVGYGVQKKSVVTASIARVTAEDLANVAPIRVDNALKGLTSGVTVTSASGQPGAAPQVRVRGIGTINSSDPLYIVDGMPIDGGIDYLNPSDISSIEVLKDAAAGAVYGARAANGVVLVTTKNGATGKMRVDYGFSYGAQNPWRKLDVLNATEYAIMMNEGFMNSGQPAPYSDPYSYGKGTDWQDKVFNHNAPMVNHQLSLSGGTDKVNYFISAGYLNQEGIVGGNFDRSNYERMSLRSNTTYNMLDDKSRNYLNKFTLGMNIAYTRVNSTGIDTNSEYGSVLGSAIALSPILGVYADDPSGYHPAAVRDKDGRVFTLPGANYNEITNPLAQLTLPGAKNNSDKFVSNFWGELTLWDNLKFRSSFGTDLAFWGSDGWNPIYYLGQSNNQTNSSVWSSMNRGFVWQIENVLSYEKQFLRDHNLQVMAGQSAKKNTGRSLWGYNRHLVEEDPDRANIDFGTGTQTNGDRNASGAAWSPRTLASLFARVSYNYKERYMFQGTIRRDGSSNFGPNNRWAVFPSLSLGWNITNEDFISASVPSWLSSAKLRFSWGKNGNENIGPFLYTALTSTGNNYVFGSGDGTIYNGTKPSRLANPDLKWEESVQTDIGIDFEMFGSAVTLSIDYYKKMTEGMLMEIPVPSYVGEAKPWGNVGTMKNNGLEFDASYRFRVGDWKFRVTGNASWIKNVLVNLGNETGFDNYDSYQNVGTISRGDNGYTWPFFYGLKTNGIFQNWDEINSYVDGEGNLIQPNARPGDVRFVDITPGGGINDDDRTMIGKGMPDWIYGSSINIGYKNFDLSIVMHGTIGNDIYAATRRTDLWYVNLPSWMLDRWTGEGTSNTVPRYSFTDDNNNWLSSDLFVKDGSYLRVKNVILGYTLPSSLTTKAFISSLRIYASAENLFTLTRYTGFDPEISSGGRSLGIDRGVYPQAKIYTVGFNLSF